MILLKYMPMKHNVHTTQYVGNLEKQDLVFVLSVSLSRRRREMIVCHSILCYFVSYSLQAFLATFSPSNIKRLSEKLSFVAFRPQFFHLRAEF